MYEYHYIVHTELAIVIAGLMETCRYSTDDEGVQVTSLPYYQKYGLTIPVSVKIFVKETFFQQSKMG